MITVLERVCRQSFFILFCLRFRDDCFFVEFVTGTIASLFVEFVTASASRTQKWRVLIRADVCFVYGGVASCRQVV